MNTKEKILLVQLLLEDIRGDWGSGGDGGGCGRDAEDRALKAKSLCGEIAKETNNWEYLILADSCDVYISSSKRWGDWDGRFFRQPFPMGYDNMDKLHNLKPTFMDKSDDFQSVSDEYLTNPDVRFDDWADRWAD